MSRNQNIELDVPATVEMTKEQAINLIKAVVFCFGTQSFSLIGVLAHRSVIDFDDISRFVFDELEAGVKVALSMAVKPHTIDVSTAVLRCEIAKVIGDLSGPIWFKIGTGSYHTFDPNAPL
jgi:hypothetical protein